MTSAPLKFAGNDYRDLLDVLIEAVEVTSREKAPQSVQVHGKALTPRGIAELISRELGYDEPLQPHHQAKIDTLFQKRQHGYGRTAYNLASRADEILADCRRQRAAPAVRRAT